MTPMDFAYISILTVVGAVGCLAILIVDFISKRHAQKLGGSEKEKEKK